MVNFINEDFLLTTSTSRRLYHDYAESLPIIDFHNHLDPVMLAENHSFSDLGELWIDSDPYKHRAMRIYGIPEESITGNALTSKGRYHLWADMFPYLMGNPLFHWSCLELKRFFDIHEILNGGNSDRIWCECNEIIKGEDFGMLDILKKCGVETLCTSDDILSDISFHSKASVKSDSIEVYPSLRGDSLISFSAGTFRIMIGKLEELTNFEINNLETYLQVVRDRLREFDKAGCRFADHSLDSGFEYISSVNYGEASALFGRVLGGENLTKEDYVKLRSYVLYQLCKTYNSMDWTLQLHVGAKRDTNTRLRLLVGPAGGYASIGSACDVDSIVGLLDSLDRDENLPKTILYTLNPSDNAVFASLTGSYSGSGVFGKVQFGPAWWYNDHMEGMERQMQSLASYGILGGFIGMTTDSRSVLSFSRHEYFRRILCRFIGEKVTAGEFPHDLDLLGRIVQNICYYNSKKWSLGDKNERK